MKNPSYSLITTTINVPYLLEDYIKDAKKHNRFLQECIVAGDNKTPSETAAFCQNLTKKYGVECRYLDVSDQKEFLSRWPALAKYLPWNCLQRRNVAILMAYQNKADIVITIDDDNLIHEPDYFGRHAHLGKTNKLTVISTKSGWWNVCEMLSEPEHVPFYHRGYPLSKRWVKEEKIRKQKTVTGRAVVNAGLWLGEPDVDGLARLYQPFGKTKTNRFFRRQIACDIGTWSPFNSQNTAMWRDVVPAYFLFPMIGRFDDIWGSYVVRHATDHLGDYVTYGSPLVRQERNAHDIFKDFDAERFGLQFNDIFLEALRACQLKATTYRDAYRQISNQFPEKITSVCSSKNINVVPFEILCQGMSIWAEVFESVCG